MDEPRSSEALNPARGPNDSTLRVPELLPSAVRPRISASSFPPKFFLLLGALE